MRKLAGAQFEASTFLSSPDPDDLAAQIVHNGEHILTWLGIVGERLDRWRHLIQTEDQEAIAAALRHVQDARLAWLRAVETGNWEPRKGPRPEASMADWLFGQSFTRRWRQRHGEKD